MTHREAQKPKPLEINGWKSECHESYFDGARSISMHGIDFDRDQTVALIEWITRAAKWVEEGD